MSKDMQVNASTPSSPLLKAIVTVLHPHFVGQSPLEAIKLAAMIAGVEPHLIAIELANTVAGLQAHGVSDDAIWIKLNECGQLEVQEIEQVITRSTPIEVAAPVAVAG